MRLPPKNQQGNSLLSNSLLAILYCICYWLCPAALHSQPMTLIGGEYHVDTRPFCKVWMDKSRSATFPQAMKRWENNEFLPLDSLALPGKFERGAYNYWIMLEVENKSRDTFPLLLYAVRMSDDSTWHFSKAKPPVIKRLSTLGEMEPTGNVSFPLRWGWVWPVLPGVRDTVLIKYYNFKPYENLLPLANDARVFEAKETEFNLRQNWIFLFGFGAIFSVLVYALAMWVSTKDAAYGWYVAYCTAIGYVSWWNVEDSVNSFHFLISMYEWTYTKVFIHTLLLSLCHAQFLKYFFKGKSPILDKAVKYFTIACAVAAVTELVLLYLNLHWSWVFYWWLRMSMVIFGLVVMTIIWRIPGRQSKMIWVGAMVIYTCELISNFLPQSMTSQAATLGILIDLYFFTVALGIRTKEEGNEKTALQVKAQTLTIEKSLEAERLRTRIAQDIHDEVGGSLTKISLAAQVAVRLPNLSETELKARMKKLGTDASQAAAQLWEIVFAINPEYDRFEEMQAYFREMAREFWHQTGVDMSLDFINTSEANPSVLPDMKRQLLLIFKEAQNNVAKHAQATQVHLILRLKEGNHYLLEVRDNGKGFDTSHINGHTLGLSGMKKRAESINAKFSTESIHQKGTTISVEGRL